MDTKYQPIGEQWACQHLPVSSCIQPLQIIVFRQVISILHIQEVLSNFQQQNCRVLLGLALRDPTIFVGNFFNFCIGSLNKLSREGKVFAWLTVRFWSISESWEEIQIARGWGLKWTLGPCQYFVSDTFTYTRTLVSTNINLKTNKVHFKRLISDPW